MREDLIERLRREAAAWDDWNEDHPDDAAVTTLPLLREAAAALEALRAERDLFRDETIELVRQNGEWQTRAERLAEALREWWSAHRPVRWTEDQHRACPYVNLPTDTDKALAEALLRDQEEGHEQ